MFNITLKVLGARLKQIREYLGISQIDLAEKVNCQQNSISRLEHGKGGSIVLVINLLNYFSNYVFIDMIFSENFYLVSTNANEEAKKNNLNSIVIELIKTSKKQYEKKIDCADKEFDENLLKAFNLLQ